MSQREAAQPLAEGQPIGKAHHLRFVPKAGLDKPSSRVVPGAVLVNHPPELMITHAAVQKAAHDGSIRALRQQAEQLLPQRLAGLAEAHGFTYSKMSVKQLKSRWGSCDQDQAIVLSLFLMQLPWEYIDYVLLHELVHTRVMRHGPDFWQAMTELLPHAKRLRKELHQYRPAVLQALPAVA
jgi:predicted metal-dependent hydrolase